MARAASVYAGSAVSPFPTPLPCTGFKQGSLTDESHPETCWSCTRLDQGSDTRTPQRSRCGGDQGMPHLGMRCYSAFQIHLTPLPNPAHYCPALPRFAQICPIWARSGRLRAGIARTRAQSCPTLPRFAQICPTWACLADSGPASLTLVPKPAHTCPTLPNLGRFGHAADFSPKHSEPLDEKSQLSTWSREKSALKGGLCSHPGGVPS